MAVCECIQLMLSGPHQTGCGTEPKIVLIVFQNITDVLADQALGFGITSPFAVKESAQTAGCPDPKNAIRVHVQSRHIITGQTVGLRDNGKMAISKTVKPAAFSTD